MKSSVCSAALQFSSLILLRLHRLYEKIPYALKLRIVKAPQNNMGESINNNFPKTSDYRGPPYKSVANTSRSMDLQVIGISDCRGRICSDGSNKSAWKGSLWASGCCVSGSIQNLQPLGQDQQPALPSPFPPVSASEKSLCTWSSSQAVRNLKHASQISVGLLVSSGCLTAKLKTGLQKPLRRFHSKESACAA